MTTQKELLKGVASLCRVKDWDYINKHSAMVTPVPEMQEYCGKVVTIVDSIVPHELMKAMNSGGIYSIFEDEGKFMWCAEWLEPIE